MQNTFSQSGNDSKWFLTKIIFQNRYVALETPSRPPPPFMANAILNFHFDFLTTSLMNNSNNNNINKFWVGQQSHFPSFAERDAVAGLRWWEGGWHYWTACTQAFHLDALLVPLLDGGGQTNSFQQIKPAKSGATSKTLALSLWICGRGLTSLQTATRIEGKFNDILTLVSPIRIVKEECSPMKTII